MGPFHKCDIDSAKHCVCGGLVTSAYIWGVGDGWGRWAPDALLGGRTIKNPGAGPGLLLGAAGLVLVFFVFVVIKISCARQNIEGCIECHKLAALVGCLPYLAA